MVSMKQKLILPVLGIAIVGGTLFGVGYVQAQATNGTTPSIVERIAQKFNLNVSDVQSVFDQDREVRSAEMQAEMEQRLTQAVSDGKINETQKQAILTKLSEMKNNKPDPGQFKNMTQDQRKQAMQQKKTELNTWAQQNGLSIETLRSLIGHGRKGFGRGFGMRQPVQQ